MRCWLRCWKPRSPNDLFRGISPAMTFAIGQDLWPRYRNRRPPGDRAEMPVRPLHVADHDGNMLEARAPARDIHGVGAAARPGADQPEGLATQPQFDIASRRGQLGRRTSKRGP